MRALKSKEIFGNWATVLLPLENDESINYQKLQQQIDALILSGVNGIYTNGTAGEFYNQDEYEFDRISEMVAEKCAAAHVPFQIGCSHASPKQSLERVKRSVHLKPGAVQLILPDWYRPSMDEVLSYLKLISDTIAPIGIVLYNPGHAKRKLLPEDYELILNSDINLVGCKTSGGDEEWFSKMNLLKDRLSVFVPGHKLATGISKSASGAYSNVACLNPKAAQDWYKLMLTDMDTALELDKDVQKFICEHIVPYISALQYSDQAVDKFMAANGGWCSISPKIRWPYRSISYADVLIKREAYKKILPQFFEVKIKAS